MSMNPDLGEYELIDVRQGRKLERLGSLRIDRPCSHQGPSQSKFSEAKPWSNLDLRFDRNGWSAVSEAGEDMLSNGVVVKLPTIKCTISALAKPTPAGHLGLFPEHLTTFNQLLSFTAQRAANHLTTKNKQPELLHLFAHTGVGSIQCAMAGFRVTHVDSSKPAIQWAKTNLELNQPLPDSLCDISIRWILEDALSFCKREVRRNRKYEVICLDPPTYGHGHGAQTWRLERDLPILFESIIDLLSESAMAVTLTGHSQRELFESLLEYPSLIRMNDCFRSRSLESVDIEARKNSTMLNAGYCCSWWN